LTIYMGTTSVDVGKTVSEIQRILGIYGATAIMIDYVDKEPDGLSFKIMIADQPISFRLPCRWKAVYQKMARQRIRMRDMEKVESQAKKIAWRQILRWVQAQLAMVDTGMVKTEEVFMQYMLVGKKGNQTLFESMQTGGWKVKKLKSADGIIDAEAE
jgi:hypothetical protein